MLSGKYRRGDAGAERGRLDAPDRQRAASERDRHVLASLEVVAAQLGRPLSDVALAWALAQPGVTSLILGARTLDQIHQNFASRDLVLTPDQTALLAKASALDAAHPYPLFEPDLNANAIFGGTRVQAGR